jgi:signal transduction histidine kinase
VYIAAALLLIGEGATPSDLAARFKRLESAAEYAGTAAILARLAQRGLVYRATTGGENARYVLTSLGQQYADASFESSPELTTRLEELERLRSDLLATIAHKLRTPLTAVRTCVGLLLDPAVELDAGTREHLLRSIEQSTDRMQQLVSDVLDLTRLRAGKVQLQLRRFDARTLARDATASLEPLLQHRGQHLKLEQPNAAIWVYGDRRRLERALLNLLSNAHKFSPEGGDRATDGEGG